MLHGIFGLIGNPVKGSRSPRLFGAAYGGKYPYELIEGEDFETSWGRFEAEFDAVNVTAPFKEMAFRKVASMPEGVVSVPVAKIGAANLLVKRPGVVIEASKLEKKQEGVIEAPYLEKKQGGVIGAANLLVKKPGGVIEAHNSDFCGVVLSIAEAYLPGITAECYRQYGDKGYIKVHQAANQLLPGLFPEAPQALVVGCGGAGKAAAVAAAELGFRTAIMNRTPEKARAFAESLPEYGFLPVPLSDFKGALRECDLVIYTLPTSIPALGELTEEDFAGDNPYSGAPSKVIIEANYKSPSFDEAIKSRIEDAGAQYVPGTRWHLYQALTGYGIMTGEMPDIAALFAAV